MKLQMQVHHTIKKVKGEVTLCPEAVATHLLLALLTGVTVARPVLRTITPNQATAHVLPVGGVYASNLQRIERRRRVKRMSGEGSATRSNPITSQRIERWRRVERMGGKGNALRGRDAP